MTDFLSDLERELRAAHPRRRAARRRHAAGRAIRSAPVVLTVLVVLAGAGAFVLSVGREDAGRRGGERPPATIPDGRPLPRGSVAVLNSTSKGWVGREVADYVRMHAKVAAVEKRVTQPYVAETSVRYAPGFEQQARELAEVLAAETQRLDATVRNEARAADIVVEIGEDVEGARVFPLVLSRPFSAAGKVGVLDRAGPRDVVSVRARVPRGRFDGLWLVDPVEGGSRVEFLGYAPPGEGERLDAVLSASEPFDDRLVISREAGTPGREPRRPIAFADLHCGGGDDCGYHGP